MKIEWIHHDETDTQLEQWTCDVNGIHLTVALVPDAVIYPDGGGRYIWSDNRTGPNWQFGGSGDLEDAMAQAVESTRIENVIIGSISLGMEITE